MQNIHQVRSAKDVLAVRLRYLGIAPNARLTFDHFPQLARASEGLAWHLTDRVLFYIPAPKNSEMPLIDLCLTEAFAWMNFRLTQTHVTPRSVQTAFLAGLLYHIPEIIHIAVRCGEEKWDPFNDAPLGDWLPRHPGATVGKESDMYLLSLRDQQIRGGMLNRMFPDGGVGLLDVNLPQVLLPPDEFKPPRG